MQWQVGPTTWSKFHHFKLCYLTRVENSTMPHSGLVFIAHIYHWCIWPCFLVRASIGPIQWGSGGFQFTTNLSFMGLEHWAWNIYGVETCSNMFLLWSLSLNSNWQTFDYAAVRLDVEKNDTLSWRVEGGVEDNLPNVWFFNIKNIPNVPKLVNSTEQSNLQLLQSSISSEMFQPAET